MCIIFVSSVIVLGIISFHNVTLYHRKIIFCVSGHNACRTTRRLSSPYAYAWTLGRIQEENEPCYKKLFKKILVSANVLRGVGSESDFWVYLYLSPNSTLQQISTEDRKLAQALGVNIVLIEKVDKESFAQLAHDKNPTINMTDYKRVMFLDGDTMPVTNLDFYFHLSDPDRHDAPTLLKPNFLMARSSACCNTGIFMVDPSKQNFGQNKELVRRLKEISKESQWWGHSCTKAEDFWESLKILSGCASRFDQGQASLYAKYFLRNISIAIGNRVQSWREGSGDLPVKESDVRDLLVSFQGTSSRSKAELCRRKV